MSRGLLAFKVMIWRQWPRADVQPGGITTARAEIRRPNLISSAIIFFFPTQLQWNSTKRNIRWPKVSIYILRVIIIIVVVMLFLRTCLPHASSPRELRLKILSLLLLSSLIYNSFRGPGRIEFELHPWHYTPPPLKKKKKNLFIIFSFIWKYLACICRHLRKAR